MLGLAFKQVSRSQPGESYRGENLLETQSVVRLLLCLQRRHELDPGDLRICHP